jgi:transcriptional regulator with XRE-family HTH domain
MDEKNENGQDYKLLVLELRKIAESKSISQQEIADRTGMLRSNINRIFQLKYSPNLNTFVAIASSIGVDLSLEDKSKF